jgi:integrase
MKRLLTDTAVKNAKVDGAGKARKLFDGGGMYLLVQPNGTKLWRYKYRLAGSEKLYAIGAYPEVGLAAARKAHEQARSLVANGADPVAERNLQRLVKAHEGAETFQGIADEWQQTKIGHATPYYLAQIRRAMRDDVYPSIGPLPIRTVQALHLRALIKKVEARGAEVVAENIRQWCSAVFRFAIVNGRAESDPAAALKGIVIRPKVKHNLALTPDQIANMLGQLKKSGGNRTTKIAIELLLLTFVRTVELRKATWGEFDLEGEPIWRVPAERMKMGVEHQVPLSKQSIALLKELRQITGASKWLFPNYRRPDDCMTATTINRALERMGLAGTGTIGFSAHGFRGTASTLLHESGYLSAAIERQLAHAEGNKVMAAYNRALYMKERTELMQDWADKIDEYRLGTS